MADAPFSGLDPLIGTSEEESVQEGGGPGCNYIEANRGDFAREAYTLRQSGFSFLPSESVDRFCRYSFRGIPLGEFTGMQGFEKHRIDSRFLHPFQRDADLLLFPQSEIRLKDLQPSVKNVVNEYRRDIAQYGELFAALPERMEFQRYAVVIQKEPVAFNGTSGEAVLEIVVRQMKNEGADLRAADFQVVYQSGENRNVVLVDVAGINLPDLRPVRIKKPSVDFEHCPEWVWHTPAAKGDLKIPGWEAVVHDDGSIEAIPRGDVVKRLEPYLNKQDLYVIEFRNILEQSEYMQSRDPVRQIYNVRLRDGGVQGLECPILVADIMEIPTTVENQCIVARTEESIKDSGAAEVINRNGELIGYYLQEGDGSFTVDGLAGNLTQQGIRYFFGKKFAKPGYAMHIATQLLAEEADCRQWSVTLRKERVKTKPRSPATAGSEPRETLREMFPDQKKRDLADLGAMWFAVKEWGGGGSVQEGLLNIAKEAEPAVRHRFILVVDHSGSMGNNIREISKHFKEVVEEVAKESEFDPQFGLVGFADTIETQVELSDLSREDQVQMMQAGLQNVLRNLKGGTEFRFDAIGRATEMFAGLGPPEPGEKRTIVVITDEGEEDGSGVDLNKDGMNKKDVEEALQRVGAELRTLYIIDGDSLQLIPKLDHPIYKTEYSKIEKMFILYPDVSIKENNNLWINNIYPDSETRDKLEPLLKKPRKGPGMK